MDCLLLYCFWKYEVGEMLDQCSPISGSVLKHFKIPSDQYTTLQQEVTCDSLLLPASFFHHFTLKEHKIPLGHESTQNISIKHISYKEQIQPVRPIYFSWPNKNNQREDILDILKNSCGCPGLSLIWSFRR